MKKIITIIILLIILIPAPANADARLRDRIIELNPLRTGADFTVVANNLNRATQEGLFEAIDEHGTTYFFRGTHELNNNVIFAEHQWKILRIEGNGNIRLIYNGICPDNDCIINDSNAGAQATIGNHTFNSSAAHNRLIGYMFGDVSGTFEQQHSNLNSSRAKEFVDEWFDNNITGDSRLLVVNDTVFCVDRSLELGSGIGADVTTYATESRISGTGIPILICPREEDRLTLPVGLITSDEANMAGSRAGLNNLDFFLRTGQWYWTMSPRAFNGTIGTVFGISAGGNSIAANGVSASNAFRPVLSLNSEVTVTGDGSEDNPFVVTGIYVPQITEYPELPEYPNQTEVMPTADNSLLASYIIMAITSLVVSVVIIETKKI